jgi:hypothetical protein
VLFTLLALAAPLPAFALNADAPLKNVVPATLNVSTTVGNCGLGGGSDIVCELNVSFNTLPGASSYTATVTRADGSVVDYGAVGAGQASLFVPYVGPGSYSVRITAYGTPPEAGGRGNVIARDSDEPVKAEAEVSDARGNNSIGKRRPGARADGSQAVHATETRNPGNAGATSGASPPPTEGQPPTTTTEQTTTPPAPPPPCEPQPNPPPPDADPNNDDEDADGVSDAQEFAAIAAGTPLTITSSCEPTPR